MKLKKWATPVGAGALALLVAYCALLGIRRVQTSSYASPQRIQALFPEEIRSLWEVALDKGRARDAKDLFSHPAIEGAFALNSAGEAVSMTMVKDYSANYYRAAKRIQWFPSTPEVGHAVVNVLGGEIAVYTEYRQTPSGPKGVELSINMAYLKSQ